MSAVNGAPFLGEEYLEYTWLPCDSQRLRVFSKYRLFSKPLSGGGSKWPVSSIRNPCWQTWHTLRFMP